MSITNVVSATYGNVPHKHTGVSLAEYLNNTTAHNTDDFIKERNERVTSNCGDLTEAMKRDKKNRNYRKNSVQAFSIVQSFSPDEADYQNVEDIDKVHEAGCCLAQRLNKKFGNKRKWAVFTQADNENHRLHNHIVVFNYDRDGKPLRHGVKWKKDLVPLNEEVMNELFTTDKQRHVREKTYQTAKRIIDANTTENGERRRGIRERTKNYVEDAVSAALEKAKTEKQFTAMLADKNITVSAGRDDKNPFMNNVDWEPTWRTKTGRLRKTIGFRYQGLVIRSNKLDKPMLTKDIVARINDNAQQLQAPTDKQQATVEPAIDKPQPVTIEPPKPVNREAPELQPQPLAMPKLRPKINKQQPAIAKQPDKPIKPAVHFSQQEMINNLRERLAAIRQQIDQEKNQQKRQWLAQQSAGLNTLLADITSQQMAAETEKARQLRQRQQRKEAEADLAL